jgi:hypothetical protein
MISCKAETVGVTLFGYDGFECQGSGYERRILWLVHYGWKDLFISRRI